MLMNLGQSTRASKNATTFLLKKSNAIFQPMKQLLFSKFTCYDLTFDQSPQRYYEWKEEVDQEQAS